MKRERMICVEKVERVTLPLFRIVLLCRNGTWHGILRLGMVKREGHYKMPFFPN